MSEAEMEPVAVRAPRSNPDLVGHEAGEKALLEGYLSNRLHHAWLITGARGIGKATLAYRFARFLLAGGASKDLFANTPESLYVRPEHPVFKRVASGGHADLLTVERGFDEKRGRMRNAIIVADVRAIGAFLSLTPAEGGWRVVVIDGAEEMNRHAANAVLKVLEEPPQRTVLLLASHAPGRLFSTIRSRCRRLALKPLAQRDVAALLAGVRPDLGADEVTALAKISEGSAGRALRLAEEGGLDLYRELVRLLAPLPELDIAAVHGIGERLGRPSGEAGYHTFTELMRWWLARLVRGGALGIVPESVVPGENALIERLTGLSGLDRWVEVWEKINRLFARADSVGLDRKQVVLTAFLTLKSATRA